MISKQLSGLHPYYEYIMELPRLNEFYYPEMFDFKYVTDSYPLEENVELEAGLAEFTGTNHYQLEKYDIPQEVLVFVGELPLPIQLLRQLF